MKVDENMLLRNGITGFFTHPETTPKSREKLIRSKLFSLTTFDKNLRIEKMDSAYPKNYMKVILSIHDLVIELYINLYYEYLYMDDTSISNLHRSNVSLQVLETFFICLSNHQVQEAVKYFSKKVKGINLPHNLNEAEIEQILYYKPNKIFDILYNDWD